MVVHPAQTGARRRRALDARSNITARWWAWSPRRAWPRRGRIEGRVIDPAAGRSQRPTSAWVAGAQHRRRWRVADHAPRTGPYRIAVRRLGYRPSRLDVEVEAGRTARVTVTLDLVPMTLDSLVVSAPPSTSPPLMSNWARSSRSARSPAPSTFDARQLIALTPGARPDQIWGGCLGPGQLLFARRHHV